MASLFLAYVFPFGCHIRISGRLWEKASLQIKRSVQVNVYALPTSMRF